MNQYHQRVLLWHNLVYAHLTYHNCCSASLSWLRDHLWPFRPHWLPHHVFDNRGRRMQCKSPLGSPEFHYQAWGMGGSGGFQGSIKPVQKQLTSRPTILSAGCICWVGDLSLDGGQMLISWCDTVKAVTKIIRRGGSSAVCSGCGKHLWLYFTSNNL